MEDLLQNQADRNMKWTRPKTARKEKLTMCAGQSERETGTEMEKFCVVMDNYFTLPHVIKHLRKHGIDVVGTARMRKGWPPP
eukprot:13824822-Ditylum_brightwellii.AAC.1